MTCEPVTWSDGTLRIIDQTLLPTVLSRVELTTAESVWNAVKTLQVRGAPAIGICAAFGVLVGVRERNPASTGDLLRFVHEVADYLATSRPTAVNLFWALDRMRRTAEQSGRDAPPADVLGRLEAEARAILAEDIEIGRRIGAAGAHLISPGAGVLTHCNAGGLATGGTGTALSVLYHAHASGTPFHAYADETRPLLQGARLTTWELQQAGIPVTLICDNMAAQVMREGKINVVIVGADRVARNGDAANKIGTYGVAVLAKAHGIPFYVAIPSSTLDGDLADGIGIPIEQRAAEEVTAPFGHRVAPEGIKVYNPAFDVTPASLIAGIITEHGLMEPPYEQSLSRCLGQPPINAGVAAT